ncbi:MAG: helicase C-terminal domain-containing protein [Promethearchaeota archaeon]
MTSIFSKLPIEVEKFFPFESLRPGQSLLAKEIYYGVLSRKNVVIEASNGLGKTITSLMALLPIVEKENKTLIYCTRTHSQMERVLEELNRIRQVKKWKITGVSLQGRTEMCINPQIQLASLDTADAMNLCSTLRKNDNCPWFENLKNSSILIEKLQGFPISASQMMKIGNKFNICPYFLARTLIKQAHVVVATYLYIIHPAIRQIFLKDIEVPLEDCIIMFDESHNLHELVMQMASDYISKVTLQRTLSEFNNYMFHNDTVEEFLTRFLQLLENKGSFYKGHYGEEEFPVGKREIKEMINQYSDDHLELAESIVQLGKTVRMKRMKAGHPSRSSLYKFGQFLITLIQTIDDKKFLHEYAYSKSKNNVKVKYYIKCMDARPLLNELSGARALVCLSGTLEPIDAYLDLCGFSRFTTTSKILPSPFPPDHLLIITVQSLDTKYYNRTPSNYTTFKERCIEVIKHTPGNTGIFCASYGVLEGVLHAGLYDDVTTLGKDLFIEQQELSSKDNEIMVKKYKEIGQNGDGAVLAGVCGGRNSEGVDFPGPEMNSVVIIGLPLAKPTYTLEALQKYYQEQFGGDKGREYGYYLPALRKSNQAAGRPVRRLMDKGAIVFLDERYAFPYYKRYLSCWIRDSMITVLNQRGILEKSIQKFFS